MKKRNLFIIFTIGIMFMANNQTFAQNKPGTPIKTPKTNITTVNANRIHPMNPPVKRIIPPARKIAPPPVVYRPYYGINVSYPSYCSYSTYYGYPPVYGYAYQPVPYPYKTGVNFGFNISI